MRDQAEELRNLVLRASLNHSAQPGPTPLVVVLTGAQPGCGVTSIAVSLALALAKIGTRLVLVDGNPHHPMIADLCGVDREPALVDIYQAGRSIHEVLQLGPLGVQVVAGSMSSFAQCSQPEKAFRRCMNQLRSLGKHTDMIVIDAGSRGDSDIQSFWHNADHVVMVTTPGSAAVMDCYAGIKMYGKELEQPAISILVNQVSEHASATEVHRRLDVSCRKFLDHSVDLLGWIPRNDRWLDQPEPRHFSAGEEIFDPQAIERIVQAFSRLLVDGPARSAAA